MAESPSTTPDPTQQHETDQPSEIKNLLSLGDGNCRQTQALAEKKLSLVHGRIRDLKAMETVLNKLVRACEKHGDTPGCPIIETLARA